MEIGEHIITNGMQSLEMHTQKELSGNPIIYVTFWINKNLQGNGLVCTLGRLWWITEYSHDTELAMQ